MSERISTGIEDIDSKLDGGFPISRGFLITGTPGAGKTIFGLHFIHKACSEGKKCIYIATEETPDDILEQAKMLDLDLSSYIDNDQLNIVRILEIRAGNIVSAVKMVDDFTMYEINLIDMVHLVPTGTDVVVIDNIGVFALDVLTRDFRNEFDTLNHLLSEMGCTTLYMMDDTAYQMTNNVADYSTHGSIRLFVKENPYTEKIERYISIPKMRSTNISPEMMLFTITSKGFELVK